MTRAGSGRPSEFVSYLQELLQPLGPVAARRMFGGYGLYLDGVMFAIVVDEELYFKVDADNQAEFEGAGSEPFRYVRQGRWVALGYYRAPEDALDGAEALTPWARSAYGAALRGRKG